MLYETLRPEVIQALAPLGLLAIGMALSQRQREAIRDERDGGKCQFPARHKCNGWGVRKWLEVHHITGQLFSSVALNQSEDEYDVPENVLTICHNAHIQKIHTDQAEFTSEDYRNGNFSRLQDHRRELAESGVKAWNTMYDHDMARRARELTNKAKKTGWVFPEHHHRW